MLKRNWNRKKIRLFCHILSLVKFQLGRGRTPCPPPLGYAYVPSEENKNGARKFSAWFLAFSNEISTVQKIVLSSSRGQANFRGLEASRPRPRTWPSRPRPRTSKCVLEAKDVLEDSTSGNESRNFRFRTWKLLQKFSIKSGLIQKRLKYGRKYFTWLYVVRYPFISIYTFSRINFFSFFNFCFLNFVHSSSPKPHNIGI